MSSRVQAMLFLRSGHSGPMMIREDLVKRSRQTRAISRVREHEPARAPFLLDRWQASRGSSHRRGGRRWGRLVEQVAEIAKLVAAHQDHAIMRGNGRPAAV